MNTSVVKHLVLAYFLISVHTLAAKDIVFDKETKYRTSTKSEFIVSKGWSLNEAKLALKSPENDVTIYFVELPAKDKPQNLFKQASRIIDPNFDLKSNPPIEQPTYGGGWEHIYNTFYNIPAKDSRTVYATLRTFKGTAYINIIDGSNSGLDKRAAQINIVLNSWAPESLKSEDLSKNIPKIFNNKNSKEFDKFILSTMEQIKIPGVAIAIIQNDRIVYIKGFGVRSKGESSKVSPDTLFMIGSVTKPFTTLMISKLVEEGKLDWDTPVKKVLPSFQLADKTITSKILMKHTACACTGMPRQDMEIFFNPKDDASAEKVIEQMALMKPTTGFGETFQYSNYLVALGGYAAASVYNKEKDLFSAYQEAMNDLVFTPLEMKNTFVKPPANIKAQLASPHGMDFKGNIVPIPQRIDDVIYNVAPAGSVWSNVKDLSKYVFMELNKGKDLSGKTLFSEQQIMLRRTPGVKIDDTSTYGLGLVIEKQKGLNIVWHDGGTLGFSSNMFFMPDHKIGMVVLTNAGGAGAFSSILKQKLLETLFNAEVKTKAKIKYTVNRRKEYIKKLLKSLSTQKAQTSWIKTFVGDYQNQSLGTISIRQLSNKYEFVSTRWTSMIGSYKEENGDRSLALTSAPWGGGLELQTQIEPVKKLIIDAGQIKYEFYPKR